MINPYVILGIAGIWIASLIGMFAWRGDEVEQVTNSKWEKAQNAELAAANKLLKDTEESYRAKESAWASVQADIITKYETEARNAKSKTDAVIAGLRNGSIGMSFPYPATPGSACGTDMPSPTPSVPGSHATASIQLPRETAANLYGLVSDANAVADQLRACQAIVIADRAK